MSFEEFYEMAVHLPSMSESEIARKLIEIEERGYGGEEIAGFAKAVADLAERVDLGSVIDTCGTGGDGANTINVSTAVAIAASCFVSVAKHGNRASSSKSGSADVLEALGVDISMNAEKARRMVLETNFAFLFAPLYHRSFARVARVRKALGIRTIFNVVGPLSNPAEPEFQLIGVATEDLLQKIAEAMLYLRRRGVVVHGDGLDEVSPRGATKAAIVDGDVELLELRPEDFGVRQTKIVPCSSAAESAARIEAVFAGRGLEEDANFIKVNFAALMTFLGYETAEAVNLFDECVASGAFLKKLEEIACKSRGT